MRKTARETAFKLIFEKSVSGGDAKYSYEAMTTSLSDDARTFLDELLLGVEAERDFLCSVISNYSSGFSLTRIYKIDLAILLVAVYEILFRDDVPVKVSANEAVELAKTYSTDKSPSYINGILATIISKREDILNERNCD